MFLLSFGKRGGHAAKRGLSHEQVPVLVALDRAGETMDCVLKAMDMTTLAAALKPFLAKDVVLCTDGSPELASAARQLGVEHHAANLAVDVHVDGAWHVQNVIPQPSQRLGLQVSRCGDLLLGKLPGLAPRARARTRQRPKPHSVAGAAA